MVAKTETSKRLSQQEIDDFFEKSSKNIDIEKANREPTKKMIEDLSVSKNRIVITENITLNVSIGFVGGALSAYGVYRCINFINNFWNSRNSVPLPSNEGNKPLQREEMISNSSAPQKAAVWGNESPQIIEPPAIVQSEKATPPSGDESSIGSLPSLDPRFKEVPGPDSMFSSIKEIFMNARKDAGLGDVGEKDRMSLKDLISYTERTIRDPRKAKKEHAKELRIACDKAIRSLEKLLKDIDPNMDVRSVAGAILTEARRGQNSEDCLKTAARNAIDALNKSCGQSHKSSLELTNLLSSNYFENNERDSGYSECSPLGHPSCSNLPTSPNNGQNCDPIPNVNQRRETTPNSDSLLSKSLQGAGELGMAGIQASIAAASARSGDWSGAWITAWEASKNAVNGVSHLAPGVGAAVSSYGNAMNQVDVHGERFDPYSDPNNSSTGPGLISWVCEKVGGVFQAYGDAMNQVDVYGERFDLYSGSNNFSIGDNSYTSDSFDYASSRGLFDRDNDPNSGWPEK